MTAPDPTQDVIRNIRAIRKARGLTAQAVCDRLGEAGLHMDRGVLAKLEKGLRVKLTVAEMFAFAYVLGVQPMDLVDCCPRCLGTPPDGFACLDCGRQGVER